MVGVSHLNCLEPKWFDECKTSGESGCEGGLVRPTYSSLEGFWLTKEGQQSWKYLKAFSTGLVGVQSLKFYVKDNWYSFWTPSFGGLKTGMKEFDKWWRLWVLCSLCAFRLCRVAILVHLQFRYLHLAQTQLVTGFEVVLSLGRLGWLQTITLVFRNVQRIVWYILHFNLSEYLFQYVSVRLQWCSGSLICFGVLLMQIRRSRPVQKDHFLGVCGPRLVTDRKVPNPDFDVCDIVRVLKLVIFGWACSCYSQLLLTMKGSLFCKLT